VHHDEDLKDQIGRNAAIELTYDYVLSPEGLLFAVFRIRKFLGLPDPDQLVRGTDPNPPIIKQKY
jgi:hypothetical protein